MLAFPWGKVGRCYMFRCWNIKQLVLVDQFILSVSMKVPSPLEERLALSSFVSWPSGGIITFLSQDDVQLEETGKNEQAIEICHIYFVLFIWCQNDHLIQKCSKQRTVWILQSAYFIGLYTRFKSVANISYAGICFDKNICLGWAVSNGYKMLYNWSQKKEMVSVIMKWLDGKHVMIYLSAVNRAQVKPWKGILFCMSEHRAKKVHIK